MFGNAFGLHPNADWPVFIANFASIVPRFLAGAEVDPDDFRERFGASLAIGLVSFVGPFVVSALVAYGLLEWTVRASLMAGTALSTTSLAVVYAELVETGLNATRIGKLIMSACFVTDIGTAIALSALFITPNVLMRAKGLEPHGLRRPMTELSRSRLPAGARRAPRICPVSADHMVRTPLRIPWVARPIASASA